MKKIFLIAIVILFSYGTFAQVNETFSGTVTVKRVSQDNTLTKILAIDSNGKFYWIDKSTLQQDFSAYLRHDGSVAMTGNLSINNNSIILSDIFGDIQSINASTGDIIINSDAYSLIVNTDGGMQVSGGITSSNFIQTNQWLAIQNTLNPPNATVLKSLATANRNNNFPDKDGTLLVDSDIDNVVYSNIENTFTANQTITEFNGLVLDGENINTTIGGEGDGIYFSMYNKAGTILYDKFRLVRGGFHPIITSSVNNLGDVGTEWDDLHLNGFANLLGVKSVENDATKVFATNGSVVSISGFAQKRIVNTGTNIDLSQYNSEYNAITPLTSLTYTFSNANTIGATAEIYIPSGLATYPALSLATTNTNIYPAFDNTKLYKMIVLVDSNGVNYFFIER